MSLNVRLAKLREKQQQITAALREAEATAATRQRKTLTRSKIIVGGVVFSLPGGERDALLSMLYGRMVERDRQFVSECLAADAPSTPDDQQSS